MLPLGIAFRSKAWKTIKGNGIRLYELIRKKGKNSFG